MTMKKRNATKDRGGAMPRASVTFPPELYKTLEYLAWKKRSQLPGLCVKRRNNMLPLNGHCFGRRLSTRVSRWPMPKIRNPIMRVRRKKTLWQKPRGEVPKRSIQPGEVQELQPAVCVANSVSDSFVDHQS
jgi:hypothetical protein